MEVKAVAKNIRMSAKKARLVVDVIRGKHVDDALNQLMFINKRAVDQVEKVLKSAIANAEHNFNLNKKDLIVKVAKVDEGFTMKRWMPRAFGRATPIRKRTCHITVTVGTQNESNVSKKESVSKQKDENVQNEVKASAKTSDKKETK